MSVDEGETVAEGSPSSWDLMTPKERGRKDENQKKRWKDENQPGKLGKARKWAKAAGIPDEVLNRVVSADED